MTDTTVPPEQCPYCGSIPHAHIEQCPSVKVVEYDNTGRIARVEKFSPLPWPYGEWLPTIIKEGGKK